MSLIASLIKLTSGLLYIGESEFSFEVMDWKNIDEISINKKIQSENENFSNLKNITTKDFFENYIYRLECSGDEVLIKDVAKYKNLLQFIQTNFSSSTVWRCGTININIYILCKEKNDNVVVIKTRAIET